jgi:malonyl CoA-acyl carrier protein transacylase
LLDCFQSFIDDHFMLAHLVQDLMRVVGHEVARFVDMKRTEMAAVLGLPPDQTENLRK